MLLVILVNLAASGAHFAHNAAFLESYPGPEWMTRPIIGIVWALAAAALLLGYRAYRKGARRVGSLGVILYCVVSLFGFAHYLYGPPGDLSAWANAFIVAEGAASLVLLTWVISQHVPGGRLPKPPAG